MFGLDLMSVFIIIITIETILISLLVFIIYYKINKIYKKNIDENHELYKQINKISAKLDKNIFTSISSPLSTGLSFNSADPKITALSSYSKIIKTSSKGEKFFNGNNVLNIHHLKDLDESGSNISYGNGISNVISGTSSSSNSDTTTTKTFPKLANFISTTIANGNLKSNPVIASSRGTDDNMNSNINNININNTSNIKSSISSISSGSDSIKNENNAESSITNIIKLPSIVESKDFKHESVASAAAKEVRVSSNSEIDPTITHNDTFEKDKNNKNDKLSKFKGDIKSLPVEKEDDFEQPRGVLNKTDEDSLSELETIEEEILTVLKRLGETKNNFSDENSN